jgi:hypothetical protein
MKEIPEYFVESTNAAKSCCESNVGHGHLSFVDELLGKEYASRLRHGDG